MKKDIEWLKEELDKTTTGFNGRELSRYEMGRLDGYTHASMLLDELDEPEKLSEEWIDEHAEHHEYIGYAGVPVDDLQNLLVPKQEITFEQVHDKLREESILSEKSFDHYWNCINDNVEIDEPSNIPVTKQDKPVIPQFAADYIEKWKYEGLIMHEWFTFDHDDQDEDKVSKWLYNNDDETNKRREFVLIDAIRYGYEVEKEKLYHVKDNDETILCDVNGKVTTVGKGNKATDWTSAPEDTMKLIDERHLRRRCRNEQENYF